jgi:hypothetical protein
MAGQGQEHLIAATEMFDSLLFEYEVGLHHS